MDIERLYTDYGIPTAEQGHKHYREGWVQTQCPFCTGDPGYHLGYNTKNKYFNCWRCGYQPFLKALGAILKVPMLDVKNIATQYGSKWGKVFQKPKITVKRKQFRMPPKLINPVTSLYHQRYLHSRGFTIKDVKELRRFFGIRGTNISGIDDIDLSYRIVAPIYKKGQKVSWQTRDCSGNSPLKYITCPKIREEYHHKDMLYLPKYPMKENYVVLCEGIFDCWKVFLAGYPVTCGFGVELKTKQILALKQYKKVYLFLDPDMAGEKKSDELYSRLIFAGVDVVEIHNPFFCDPGDLRKNQIKKIMRKNGVPRSITIKKWGV